MGEHLEKWLGRLKCGWSKEDPQGLSCAKCGKGGGYLVGEPGKERHLKCWRDRPGPSRRAEPPDPGPRLFEPDR